MKIRYTEHGKRRELEGNTVWDCIAQLAIPNQKEYALKNMPVNVSPDTFTRLMRESYEWQNITVLGNVGNMLRVA